MSLSIQQLCALKIGRYEVYLRASADAELPPFLGSALRGAFGHALKEVSCSMPHGNCGRCLLVERCLYPRLFETSARNAKVASASEPGALLKKSQDAPRPFIFIPPLPSTDSGFMRARDDLLRWRVRVNAGEPVVFGLSLIGDAINDLPYVVYAIGLMAQHGFGAERASFALERVAALDANGNRQLIYTSESNRIEEHASCQASLGALVQARLNALPIANCQLPIEGSAAAAASGPTTMKSRARSGPASAVAAASGSTTMPAGAEPTMFEAPIRNAQSLIRNSQSEIRNEVSLRFVTPTRMRLKGRVIESPTFAQLVSSLSLRLSMLAETFADTPLSYDYKSMIERAHEVTTRDSTLRLMALDRYSNRRGGKLELDGFMGEVTFTGTAIQELLPLLVAGEFLHVGSGTAFGLGRYLIV